MSGRRQYNEDSITIRLSSGGSVSVSFRGTLFELTEEEQALVRDLTLTIQRYKQAQYREVQAVAATLTTDSKGE